MIHLYLIPAHGEKRTLDHVPGFSLRIHFNELHCHPDRPPIVHRSVRWYSNGGSYSAISLESPVRIQFERGADRSRTYGPFRRTLFCQGTIHAEDQGCSIARLVADHHWVECDTGQRGSDVVVAEAIDSVPPVTLREHDET